MIPRADIDTDKDPLVDVLTYDVDNLDLLTYNHTLICLTLDAMVRHIPMKLKYEPVLSASP